MKMFIDRVKETDAGCWEWQGHRKKFGHGSFGRSGLAHRHSWKLFRGPTPNGLCVLHKCDNPPCVNPNHLFLGTIRDNNEDRSTKGRNGINGNAGRIRCIRGHEFNVENTYYRKDTTARQCKICRSVAMKNFNDKKRNQNDCIKN